MLKELSLQRLFSTFANGLPGIGLMLQRLVTGASLVCGAFTHFHAAPQLGAVVPQVIEAGAGVLVIFGLWTPIVGTIIACGELWIALSTGGNLWLPFLLATFGATLAMIGPGAWSVDARLFGRRQIKRPR